MKRMQEDKELLKPYQVAAIIGANAGLVKKMCEEGHFEAAGTGTFRKWGRENRYNLYDSDEIQDALEKEDVQKRIAAWRKRSERANPEKALKTRVENLVKWVKEADIEVESGYSRHEIQKEDWKHDYRKDNKEHHKRWMSNYVRHELTRYDSILADLTSKPGAEEAYKVLQNRIHVECKKHYSWYVRNK